MVGIHFYFSHFSGLFNLKILMKIYFFKSLVSGNVLTYPVWYSNPDSGKRGLAVSGSALDHSAGQKYAKYIS